MDNSEELRYPYYEMTYLDDYNVQHLARVENADLSFYKDRFTVVKYDLKQT